MFGWWPKNLVFQKLGVAVSSISHSINYAMLYQERKELGDRIKYLSQQLDEKNKAMFEAGVRHGFWNVESVAEIKQNYEVYKPSAM